MLIDSHTHIHFKDFQNETEAILNRAQKAGVSQLVNVATDLATSRTVIEIATRYPGVFAAVGVHPHDVAKMADGDLAALKSLASSSSKVVAIGEVGLDYYYEHSPKDVQQSRLRDFVKLSAETKLPLIIHCRDAFEDCFRILDEENGWKQGGVFHCYTGNLETAEKILKKGFYVSFSGIVTFKKSQELQEVARRLSRDRFLIETDCPFLAPEPHRGKRNEPAYVRLVASKLAELRGVSFEEIAALTSRNTRELFRIAPIPLI